MKERLKGLKLNFLAALLAFSALACAPSESGQASEPPPAAPDSGRDAAAQLPAGHPPVVSPTTSARVVPPIPGSGTGAAALTWEVPAGWVEESPASSMRRAQYRVPGSAGDGECVVFYFGPGEGGSPMANALRWADQFAQEGGGSSREALETREVMVNGKVVLFSEVTGSYSGGMTMMGQAPQRLENYMLLGAVAPGPDANWFFKFTGPEATVQSQKAAFEAMIGSLRPGT